MSRTHRNIWQHEKPSTASKASYVATICTSILGRSSSYHTSCSAEKRTPFDNAIYNYYNWGKR